MEKHKMEEDETKEAKKIEINNAKEEIFEIVEKCNKCGLCKELDVIWLALKEEAQSSRGKAILLEDNKIDKNLFDDTLSGTCRELCPFKIDIDDAIRKARQILNLKGNEHPINKNILKKIQNNENPFKEN